MLNFRKPSRWIVAAASVLVIGLSVGFAVNGADLEKTPQIPDVFAYDTGDMAAEAEFLKFVFAWDYGVADSLAVWQGDYADGNTLTVAPGVAIRVAHPANRDVALIGGSLYLPDGAAVIEDCAFSENGGKSGVAFTTIDTELPDIGDFAAEIYLKSRMAEKIPVTERISGYAINDVSVMGGDILL